MDVQLQSPTDETPLDLKHEVRQFEIELIRSALQRTGGVKAVRHACWD